jgi:hypothetical protein
LNVADEVRVHQRGSFRGLQFQLKRSKKASLNINGELIRALSVEIAGAYIREVRPIRQPSENPHPIPPSALSTPGLQIKAALDQHVVGSL